MIGEKRVCFLEVKMLSLLVIGLVFLLIVFRGNISSVIGFAIGVPLIIIVCLFIYCLPAFVLIWIGGWRPW